MLCILVFYIFIPDSVCPDRNSNHYQDPCRSGQFHKKLPERWKDSESQTFMKMPCHIVLPASRSLHR